MTARLGLTAFVLFATILATIGPAPLSAQVESVRDFVRGQYYHGLPPTQAGTYGPEALADLVAILEDPAEKDAWANAIDLIGRIGDESAAPALVDFFENRFVGEVDAKTFAALTLAPVSLGKIAGSADGPAVRFLERGVGTGAWSAGRADWSFPTLNDSERPEFLTGLVVRGLALAATPRTLEVLKRLQSEAPERGERFLRVVAPELDEAIVVNEILIERGREFMLREDFEGAVEERLQRRRPPK